MAKKKSPTKLSVLVSGIKRHKVATFLYIVFVVSLSIFLYGRYIDYRNVQDMKHLLADFQQLERDMEAETGEDFYITASCTSVGKFATSYACYVNIKPVQEKPASAYSEILLAKRSDFLKNNTRCEFISKNSYKVSDSDDHYNCIQSVNNSNRN